MKTKDAMVGRWRSALREYGLTDQQLSGKHCACPMCGGSDRFRFDNKEGKGTWFCNGCGAGDGFKLLMRMHNIGFPELAAELDKRVGNFDVGRQETRDSSSLIRRIGAGLRHLSDIDPVVIYLRARAIHAIPRDFLRFHPSAYHWQAKRTLPAMIAALRDAMGRVHGYHMTFLNERGGKADIETARLYTPGATGECVIRLSDVAEHIGLAEGVETALSVTELYGLPCWATGDAGRMAKFVTPVGVERVTIFSDVDHNYAGEAAAFALAHRLARQGIQCEVRQNCPRGSDYNDLLKVSVRDGTLSRRDNS